MFDRNKPNNDLSLLPPSTNLEDKEILKKAIAANKALGELKGISLTIPDQSILINTLPFQEAQSSSEIENVLTTSDKLFQAFASQNESFDPQTKEVMRYREALWEGYNELKKKSNLLTTNLFIKIYRRIKQTDAGIRNTPGTRISNSKGEIIYTPPEGENQIRALLKNLEEFIHNNKDGIDTLIKLAVIHYQFEAIHPFTDGNGRTGRIINILYLVQNKLLDLPIIYLSKYIIEHKNDYYRLLREISENNIWKEWIIFMLDAVEQTSRSTTQKIADIKLLLEKTTEDMKQRLPSRVYSKELVELLFKQPYCKVEFVVTEGIAKRQTAADYLKEVEKTGLLKSSKVGKEVLYLNKYLFDILSR